MNMNPTGNPYQQQQQQLPWQATGTTNMSFSNPVSGNPMFPQFTGMTSNPYQQQTIANPYQQQQQFTGVMQQPMITGMQFQTPQMTGMQYQQPQPTGMQFPTSSITSMQTGQNNPFGPMASDNSQQQSFTAQSNFASSPSMQTSTFGQSLQTQQTGFQQSSFGSQSPQPSHFSTDNQTVRWCIC